ncbi:MAG TPA: anti-sigma factor [Pseudolabrys sp.]|jgi:anti-sigma factor RsiW|nr:anti-sigma factor [Pseudolabrys sp.]
MTRSRPDDNSVLLVHAYLDGELDPANALGIEQQMSTEPALAAESERVKALQRLIHERLAHEEAPPGLRARIEASVGGLRRSRAQPSWRALAASIALTAMVASGSTWVMVGSEPTNMVADSLVSGHIRALMAPEAVDVLSSDRHTVKPWFNGRIPTSPRVVDLDKQNFPLVGGRIDVVGQTPVSTLVYRRAKHLISLTAMPAESHFELSRTPRTVNGYNVVHWVENGVSYWAISDVAHKDLEEFAQLFRTSPTECTADGAAPCQ